MPIEVVCPSCDTSHKVKDDSAGKKLKCKGCEKIIPIPALAEVAEADPWEGLDENEGGEDVSNGAPRVGQRRSSVGSPRGTAGHPNVFQRFLLYALKNPWVGGLLFFVFIWVPISFAFTEEIVMADFAIAGICGIALILGSVLAFIGVSIRNPFQMLHLLIMSVLFSLFVPPALRYATNRAYANATNDSLGKTGSLDTGVAGSIAGHSGMVMGVVVVHLILLFALKNAGIVRFG